MPTTIEIPDRLKSLVPALQRLIDESESRARRAAIAGTLDYSEFEKVIESRVAELECAVHGSMLGALDVDATRVTINGVVHTKVGRHSTTYMTKAGPVEVSRSLFRRVGDRNGPTVDLVALRAQMVEGVWLPAAARAMARFLAQGTSREAETLAKEAGRLPYSRTSFERIGHAVGAAYVGNREAIDRAVIDRFEAPAEATSISVSLDRVAVPMEEPLPRPVGRPRKGAPKRPVARVWHMAYCGSVTLHDATGEALHTIRCGTMPAGDAQRLCERMADEVLAVLSNTEITRVTLVCDGAPEMWNLLDAEFPKERFLEMGIQVVRLVDYWHVIEKLSAAASVIDAGGDGAVARTWRVSLLNQSHAAEGILAELQASGRRDVLVGKSRPVHDAITYLENHADRLNYRSARRQGLPIGSGNVEATCKSLFGVRMNRGGARWKHQTGEEVINLRALALSDSWDVAMPLVLQVPHVAIRRVA